MLCSCNAKHKELPRDRWGAELPLDCKGTGKRRQGTEDDCESHEAEGHSDGERKAAEGS